MSDFFSIFITSMLVKNPLVFLFLGLCSFVGITKKIPEAFGMSVAVIFVTFLAQQVTFFLNIPLVSFGLFFLQLLVFIMVIAALVQAVEIVMKKFLPVLHCAFGVFLPLITTNCLVLYVALDQIFKDYSYAEATGFGLGTGFGYLLMMVIMAGLREQMELSTQPEIMEGTAATVLLLACILSLAMQGFSGVGG
jgi:electron transport complex protein RnfA